MERGRSCTDFICPKKGNNGRSGRMQWVAQVVSLQLNMWSTHLSITETGYSLANYEVVKSLILCRYTDIGWVSFSLCTNPMYQSVSALNMKWNRRGNRPLHNLTTGQFLCWRAYKIQHCCFLWDSFSNGGTPAQFEYHSLFCFWKDLLPLFVNYESKWRVWGFWMVDWTKEAIWRQNKSQLVCIQIFYWGFFHFSISLLKSRSTEALWFCRPN